MEIESIKDVLASVFGKYKDAVVFAYLFGSAAGDTVYPLSDIDIAVFLSDAKKETDFNIKLSLYSDFCRALKRNDIDIVVLNAATNIVLLDEIIRHGVLIYDTATELRKSFECRILHQAIDFKEQRFNIIGV